MNYSLWIDDRRDPKQNSHVLVDDSPLFWVQTVEEAKLFVSRHGMPITMYLDHDLGEDSTVMEFLRWLESSGHPPTFEYVVISANPDGAKSIVSFIESWKKVSQERGKSCQ